ncbi:MAG: hypothetical protein WCS42_22695 [Verrucomicrobiota bacterium]
MSEELPGTLDFLPNANGIERDCEFHDASTALAGGRRNASQNLARTVRHFKVFLFHLFKLDKGYINYRIAAQVYFVFANIAVGYI